MKICHWQKLYKKKVTVHLINARNTTVICKKTSQWYFWLSLNHPHSHTNRFETITRRLQKKILICVKCQLNEHKSSVRDNRWMLGRKIIQKVWRVFYGCDDDSEWKFGSTCSTPIKKLIDCYTSLHTLPIYKILLPYRQYLPVHYMIHFW